MSKNYNTKRKQYATPLNRVPLSILGPKKNLGAERRCLLDKRAAIKKEEEIRKRARKKAVAKERRRIGDEARKKRIITAGMKKYERVLSKDNKQFLSENDINRVKVEVSKAIRNGLLPPASYLVCVDCNEQARHYHHEMYCYPLHVIPLCASCHSKRHSYGVL